MAQLCLRQHDTKIYGRTRKGCCKECRREDALKVYHSNPKVANSKRRRYNWQQQKMINPDGTIFTTVNFDRLYQVQQGKCAICKRHNSELTSTLGADHDHKTGIVRGLLCAACNARLGTYEAWLIPNLKVVTDYLRR